MLLPDRAAGRGLRQDPRWSADRKRSVTIAKTLAQRALAASPDDQMALLALGAALNFGGELDDAITTTRRLLQLNPNDSAASFEDYPAGLLRPPLP